MEQLLQIVDRLLDNFDFTYCLIVNLLTYFTIKILNEGHKKIKTSLWIKRAILIMYCFLIGVLYYEEGVEYKILFNSAVLAPVFWSWIMKPICKKIGVDYIKFDNF